MDDLLRRELEWQANEIERVLHNFGIYTTVFAGDVLPQFVSYQVDMGPGQRLREVETLHRELAIALDVKGVMIKPGEGCMVVEVPRGFSPVYLGDIVERLPETPGPHTVLLGLSDSSTPLLLYMASPLVAHVLVAGMTGCGKTELLRTMITSLSLWSDPREVGVYLIDPTGKLADLGRSPIVHGLSGADDAPYVLDGVLREMERRESLTRCPPRIYLVIDELADLVLVNRAAIEGALTRLVQRGRGAGIHVIASTQRPSAAVVQGIMKANFPVRISGAVNSALDASIATGVPQSGAERLLGRGDMLLASGGELVRFQTCMTLPGTLPTIEKSDQGKVRRVGESVEAVLGRMAQRLGLRGPGRPAKGATPEMITFAMSRLQETGKCTQRQVRRWHKRNFGTDVNPPRAAEAISEAKRRLGLRFS